VSFTADLNHLQEREQLMRYAGLGSESQGSTVPAGMTELGLTEKSGGCCGPTGCC